MTRSRSKPPSAPAAALLLSLAATAAAGCAGDGASGPRAAPPPPAGFTADTFTRAGLVGGASATEAGCRALPDGPWVDIGRRRECLRHATAGTEHGAGRTALVYIPGDPDGAAYRFAGGRVHVEGVNGRYEQSPGSRRAAAEALSGAMGGTPVVLMARPGMHGSSGDHAQDRHGRAEVELLDAALTELRRRYGFRDFALAGFSSGGVAAADLLARRGDIRCAALASAPLDLAAFYRGRDGLVPDHYALLGAELADPMRAVRALRTDAAIFVLGDRRDRIVPAAAWEAWVAAARRAGLRVYVAEATGLDRPELGGSGETHHHTAERAIEAAYACAAGVPAERVQRALLLDEPVLTPRGQRLGGAEIRAAFAGRLLRGVEWHPEADVSTYWDPGGELRYLDPRRPERRIRETRWWVDGDRLCTPRGGCGEVVADGRFLHTLGGRPPRLAATYLADAEAPLR
jgi:predicted esterase